VTPSSAPPPPLLVFAQPGDARADVDAWSAHAARFFATRVGLANEEHSFVVAPDGHPPGIRAAVPRPSTAADFAEADAAEIRSRGAGLAPLARRCKTVWVVAREAPSDALALRLAVILASVFLGPILDPASGEIFGVKTGRAKVESLVQSRTS
jgi:hypothetical protein